MGFKADYNEHELGDRAYSSRNANEMIAVGTRVAANDQEEENERYESLLSALNEYMNEEE